MKDLTAYLQNTKEMHTTNKIIISSLHLLCPSAEKEFNLNIVINGGKPLKGKTLEFEGNNNSCVIGQSFLIDIPIKSLDTICFQIFDSKSKEGKIPFLKGEVQGSSQVRDSHSQNLICYLKTSNNEDFAVIYYNFEFEEDDLFQKFIKNKKAKEAKNTISILDYPIGNQNDSYSLFIHNYDYLNIIITISNDIIEWKNARRNFGLLILMSLMIISFKMFFVFCIPLGFIAFHWFYKGRINKNAIMKRKEIDKDNNTQLLLKTINMINALIMAYEKFIIKLAKSEKKFIEEIYLNLIKVAGIAFVIVYIPIQYILPIKIILLICIWYFLLSYNSKCYSLYAFIGNFIQSKLGLIKYDFSFGKKIKRYLYDGMYIATPFLQMIYPQESMIESSSNRNKQNSVSPRKSANTKPKLQKYEIYENERWWVVVGWTKKMLTSDCPLWCSVDDLKTFCDKSMISLINEKEYKWVCEWKIEKNYKTDIDGWSYGDDFQSEFNAIEEKKFVRRRKWVKYASPISKENTNDT